MIRLVLLRHGESTWNKQNRFTGWTDVGLSAKGMLEAKKAGKILKSKGYKFDIAFTSVLRRAKHTFDLASKELNQKIPILCSWRLNERHYGALQGLNKLETVEKYGEKKVYEWRRSYDIRPPRLLMSDKRYPGNDKKYSMLNHTDLPRTESLKDTFARVKVLWRNEIAPAIKDRKKIIISAHGNSLRALVKLIDKVSDEKIASLDIPTGIPLVYELDEKTLRPLRHYYLGDKKMLDHAISKVRDQTKK